MCIRDRNNTQPVEYPSAGSVFMNTKESKAGKIIQDLNLKGYSIGGAKISELHANYIINTGGAKIKDIKTLMFTYKSILNMLDTLYEEAEDLGILAATAVTARKDIHISLVKYLIYHPDSNL